MARYRFGRCTFEGSSRLVRCEGNEVVLRAKVAELLCILLERPNEVVANDTLRDRLWPDGFVEMGNLAQQVYLLRRALAIDPTVAVENVARSGYRLSASIPEAATPASPWRALRTRVVWAVAAAAVLVVVPGAARLLDPSLGLSADAGDRTYVLGRYFWERRGIDNLRRARAFFEQTVHEAPESAKGYAGLADVWGVLADGEPYASRSRLAHAAVAQRYARTALAKDPQSAVAHAALGLALLEGGAPASVAESEFRAAIELDPRNAEAHEWYGIRLLEEGNLPAARAHFVAAANLQPENVAVAWWLAVVRYDSRDANDAVTDFRTAVELNPSYTIARIGLVLALVEAGRYHDAESALRTAQPMSRSEVFEFRALEAILAVRMGRRSDAVTAIRMLVRDETGSRSGDEDELVVAALALGGRRHDALRVRARMHLERDAESRRMIELDPLVGPVFRALGPLAAARAF